MNKKSKGRTESSCIHTLTHFPLLFTSSVTLLYLSQWKFQYWHITINQTLDLCWMSPQYFSFPGSNPRSTLPLSTPLVHDSFSILPWFSWSWQFWRVLVRYFVKLKLLFFNRSLSTVTFSLKIEIRAEKKGIGNNFCQQQH